MEKAREKFLTEATELIDDLERAVLLLEKSRHDHAQLQEVFRVMHTFKGTAKMFGYDQIGEFTHYLENIYDDLRNGRTVLSDEVLEISLSSVDHIRRLLHEPTASTSPAHTAMMETLKRLSADNATTHTPSKAELTPTTGKLFLIGFEPHVNYIKDGSNPLYLLEDLSALGTLVSKTHADRIPQGDAYNVTDTYLYWDVLLFTHADARAIRNEFMFVEDQCTLAITEVHHTNLLDDPLFIDHISQLDGRVTSQVVDVYVSKKVVSAQPSTVRETAADAGTARQTIRVTYEKIDKLLSIVSELVTTQARLSLFADGTRNTALEEISENVEKLVRQLRDEAFSISLLPISHLSMRFERLVRDTSKELNKKIRFITTGGDTALDKKIIENLMDPMLHILRNSIDHGIETPAVRMSKGKDETGTIHLKAYYSGANVIIEVHDDGSGIDKERVWQKALQQGLARDTDALSDREIFDFIFHPGFSTAKAITDVSGRGVGMDVVKRAIVHLRGEIEVESQPNKGTVIRLRMPLSLSIIDGLLVNIEKSKYVIPLTAIDKCYEVQRDTIRPDMHDLIVLEGEQVPYINLRNVFNSQGEAPPYVNLIVAKHEDRKVALEVDSIVDEYQAVIKPLGKMYKDQDFASGATILGNGTVALVLDTNRLIARLSDN